MDRAPVPAWPALASSTHCGMDVHIEEIIMLVKEMDLGTENWEPELLGKLENETSIANWLVVAQCLHSRNNEREPLWRERIKGTVDQTWLKEFPSWRDSCQGFETGGKERASGDPGIDNNMKRAFVLGTSCFSWSPIASSSSRGGGMDVRAFCRQWVDGRTDCRLGDFVGAPSISSAILALTEGCEKFVRLSDPVFQTRNRADSAKWLGNLAPKAQGAFNLWELCTPMLGSRGCFEASIRGGGRSNVTRGTAVCTFLPYNFESGGINGTPVNDHSIAVSLQNSMADAIINGGCDPALLYWVSATCQWNSSWRDRLMNNSRIPGLASDPYVVFAASIVNCEMPFYSRKNITYDTMLASYTMQIVGALGDWCRDILAAKVQNTLFLHVWYSDLPLSSTLEEIDDLVVESLTMAFTDGAGEAVAASVLWTCTNNRHFVAEDALIYVPADDEPAVLRPRAYPGSFDYPVPPELVRVLNTGGTAEEKGSASIAVHQCTTAEACSAVEASRRIRSLALYIWCTRRIHWRAYAVRAGYLLRNYPQISSTSKSQK